METYEIDIRIKTQGEPCEMSLEEIRRWYEEKIRGLFDPAYGSPEISVSVEKK